MQNDAGGDQLPLAPVRGAIPTSKESGRAGKAPLRRPPKIGRARSELHRQTSPVFQCCGQTMVFPSGKRGALGRGSCCGPAVTPSTGSVLGAQQGHSVGRKLPFSAKARPGDMRQVPKYEHPCELRFAETATTRRWSRGRRPVQPPSSGVPRTVTPLTETEALPDGMPTPTGDGQGPRPPPAENPSRNPPRNLHQYWSRASPTPRVPGPKRGSRV